MQSARMLIVALALLTLGALLSIIALVSNYWAVDALKKHHFGLWYVCDIAARKCKASAFVDAGWYTVLRIFYTCGVALCFILVLIIIIIKLRRRLVEKCNDLILTFFIWISFLLLCTGIAVFSLHLEDAYVSWGYCFSLVGAGLILMSSMLYACVFTNAKLEEEND